MLHKGGAISMCINNKDNNGVNKQGDDDDMSKLAEFIKENKESVYLFATKNTPKNKDGNAIITKDDEWRLEGEWDQIFNETMEE